MIRTLHVKLLCFVEEGWSADIEIDSMLTLDRLHHAIQDAVGFDDDHMYAFYISKTERSRDREYIYEENGQVYTIPLGTLFPLEKGKSLYYLFDFGDSWLFKVTHSRKRPHEPQDGVIYPRVVEEVGSRPEQYAEEDGF